MVGGHDGAFPMRLQRKRAKRVVRQWKGVFEHGDDGGHLTGVATVWWWYGVSVLTGRGERAKRGRVLRELEQGSDGESSI